MRGFLTLSICILSMACANEVQAPVDRGQQVLRFGLANGNTQAPSDLSPREDALIRQLEDMFPGDRGAQLRATLTDPRVYRVRMPANPRADRILNEIASLRLTRAESAATAARETASQIVPVMLAVKPDWADTSLSAIVVHRTQRSPHDLLLVPPNASAANVGAGIKALTSFRHSIIQTGDRDAHITVHGAAVPGSWTRTGLDKHINAQLAALASAPAHVVPGYGLAKTVELPVFVRAPKQ